MPGPVLLVHDDLSVIAQIKRLLARDGYEVVLATSAADAVIAFGHHLPMVILLAPSVESDRGHVVLDELKHHPDGQLARVILLGETIPGFGYPMAAMPPDDSLLEMVNELAQSAGDSWTVQEHPKTEPTPDDRANEPTPPPSVAPEGDDWRAAPPSVTSGAEADDDVPEASPDSWAAVPSPAPTPKDLEGALFGDLPSLESELHREVEAQAMASVDDELLRRRSELEAPRPSPVAAAFVAEAPLPAAEQRAREAEARQLELREVADRARRAASRAAVVAREASQHASADLERLRRDVEHADELTRHEREQRAQAEDALQRAAAEVDGLREQVQLAQTDSVEINRLRAELEQAHQSHQALIEELRAELQGEREATEAELKLARQTADEDISALRDENRTALEASEAELARLRDEQQSARASAEAELQQLREVQKATRESADAELQRLRDEHRAALEQHQQDAERTAADARSLAEGQQSEAADALRAAEAAHEETRSELALLSHDYQQLQARSTDAAGKLEQLEASERSMREQAERLATELGQVAAQLDIEGANRRDVEKHAVTLQAQIDELKEQLGGEQTRAAELELKLQDSRVAHDDAVVALRAQVDTERQTANLLKNEIHALTAERADLSKQLGVSREHELELQEAAEEANERAKELEARAIMPLAPEGRPPLQVARHGAVTLGELSRLVAQLVIAQVEVKLELAVTGGTRALWLKRGQLVAAESSLPYETLSDRARRDGLIDGRQETELRSVRGASAPELLQVMRERGLVRQAEVVPLVQRYTEQVALDAFTEAQCTYRLVEEAPPPEVLAAATPRATLPIVAEALRRALPPESLLEMLGGSEGVPVALDTDLDARSLGFSERERKMLGFVDGEATVEMLVMAAALKPDTAYKALVVARLLGLIEVRLPEKSSPGVSPQLDVQRLDAKYDQVQDADYFSILGLPRNAGTEEVQRAFDRLATEFDPIRYSGHPDASLQQRAQVVFNLLEEAAKALEDDRRRVEYARHLLD